jgi:hypothetical protein
VWCEMMGRHTDERPGAGDSLRTARSGHGVRVLSTRSNNQDSHMLGKKRNMEPHTEFLVIPVITGTSNIHNYPFNRLTKRRKNPGRPFWRRKKWMAFIITVILPCRHCLFRGRLILGARIRINIVSISKREIWGKMMAHSRQGCCLYRYKLPSYDRYLRVDARTDYYWYEYSLKTVAFLTFGGCRGEPRTKAWK